MDLQFYDMAKGEKRILPPASRCIYCGDIDVELTDEHVIPYALGGDTVILEDACCVPCQRLIQPYEQRILRHQLGVFRARIGATRRRKKDQPTHKVLQFVEVDENGQPIRELCQKTLPLDETPLSLSVWELAPPRILGEEFDDAEHIGRPWTYVQHDLAMRLAAEVREETGAAHVAVKVDQINREDFLRFLAKTAHAYAISELGFGAFQPLATDAILRKSDALDFIVGGDFSRRTRDADPATMTELTLGKVSHGQMSGATVVRIHLYPLLGTPAHVVIVGTPN